jgi:hypothetical protein
VRTSQRAFSHTAGTCGRIGDVNDTLRLAPVIESFGRTRDVPILIIGPCALSRHRLGLIAHLFLEASVYRMNQSAFPYWKEGVVSSDVLSR